MIDNSTRKIAVAIASSAAFVVMGAPTCGSDGRRTAEEVEADVARRHRQAVQEQAELTEIEARVTGASVELEVDPPPDSSGWTEDRAIFSRSIKDSRGEELQESIGVSSPFSDVG